jgi:hypothetical protein
MPDQAHGRTKILSLLLSLPIGAFGLYFFFHWQPMLDYRFRLSLRAQTRGLGDPRFALFVIIPASFLTALAASNGYFNPFVIVILGLLHRLLLLIYWHRQGYVFLNTGVWIKNWRLAAYDGLALAATALAAGAIASWLKAIT